MAKLEKALAAGTLLAASGCATPPGQIEGLNGVDVCASTAENVHQVVTNTDAGLPAPIKIDADGNYVLDASTDNACE